MAPLIGKSRRPYAPTALPFDLALESANILLSCENKGDGCIILHRSHFTYLMIVCYTRHKAADTDFLEGGHI